MLAHVWHTICDVDECDVDVVDVAVVL